MCARNLERYCPNRASDDAFKFRRGQNGPLRTVPPRKVCPLLFPLSPLPLSTPSPPPTPAPLSSRDFQTKPTHNLSPLSRLPGGSGRLKK